MSSSKAEKATSHQGLNFTPDPIGTPTLSAWRVAPSTVWIQTRMPAFARKLARRQDGRLVATGVAGGFLRIFEFQHPVAWAERLIHRYLSKLMVTNGPFLNTDDPLAA